MGAVPVGGFTPLVVGQGANPNVVSSAHHIHGIINNNPSGDYRLIDRQIDRSRGIDRVSRNSLLPSSFIICCDTIENGSCL